MIKANITYAESTPESCEIGDFSDTGVECEGQEYTFKELVEFLQDNLYSELSNSHEITEHTWISTQFEIKCYITYTSRQLSMHYMSGNVKYWIKALNYIRNS